MIDHLNNLLRDLFMARIDQILDEAQVRFQPPDDDWRSYVSTLTVGGNPVNALNIYLFDLRENRKRRSNERVRVGVESGQVVQAPAPARVSFHYLVTAWSPATLTPAVEPTLDEHVLLYEALAVLMQNAPLNPSRIYPPGSGALLAVPELIREANLPTQVVPPDGFPKLAEFWGTMGTGHRWKPAIYLAVTLPVILLREIAGPMVTTRITEYRRTGHPETAETWIQIGGHVLDATEDPPVPVPDAWVRLETTGGEVLQTTGTNELGRFTFERLQAGQYQLRWRATGYPVPAAPRMISVPSPSGEYDLKFE
jgi:hypothetical protein